LKATQALKSIAHKYNSTSLIVRILIGLIIGSICGVFLKSWTPLGLFGDVFVGALKAIAPVLVFVLVISALAQKSSKLDRRFGMVIFLYMLSTFLAAFVANIGDFLFPQTVVFPKKATAESVPQGIGEVMKNLLTNIVDNPIKAITEANYICILFWAVVIGLAFKVVSSEAASKFLKDTADAITIVVRWIINFAPFGIFGITYTNVSTNGLGIFKDYGSLILLLVGCMLTVALVVDPLISSIVLRRNSYPLVWRCLKESGLTAFFTRSSAANIPVNLSLCERLGLDEDMYSVSIPLGATINMDGAAITISIMTLTAANTLGIQVDFATSLILCVLSALGACGASGVAGGSLMLIPMACSLFGISNDTAMQMVAIGFIVGVVQDSLETALNSSGDVMFAATAEYHQWIKEGKDLPYFLGGTRKLDV
jgi:serine/threonine transporter